MRYSVRQLLLFVVLAAVNLTAAGIFLGHYPRRSPYGAGLGGAYRRIKDCEDGSQILFQVKPDYTGMRLGTAYDPHMINPPRPSLLRIVSPVIASITVSLLVIIVAIHSRTTTPNSRTRTSLYLAAGVTILLVSPAVQIMCDPKNDYHAHELKSMPQGLCYHASPFWARYRRLLLWRSWPGDFACPIPPETPYPPTYDR